MALSKKYKFTADTFFTVNQDSGRRELKQEYLEQILDAIAECQGGYSACRGGLILFDTVTGDKTLITIASGTLVDAVITD
jgi:hypothetical protein